MALLVAPPAGADEAQAPKLPEPFATPSVKNFSKVVGWPEDKMPTAPKGFTVTRFAKGLDNPRWLYQLPNGDLLVAESSGKKPNPEPKKLTPEEKEKEKLKKKSQPNGVSANRITILRDEDGDGKPELQREFLTGLSQPLGMALIGDMLYVANTDAVVRFPYKTGMTEITAEGEKVLDLPAGGYNAHWTRNILPSADGKSLFVTVGSSTNVDEERRDEKEPRRAAVLKLDLETKKYELFGTGLRNPVGLDIEPQTGALWTAVNERDGLGDHLVPDYITSVKPGGFYGWPYSYFGQNVDPRKKGERPDLVEKALVPDMALGAHTASLGLTFYTAKAFPERYRGGAFVGQHGSWNRSDFAGYKVAFVPFKGGMPSGPVEDFLTGFIKNNQEVYGRPVGVITTKDGALLVADDAGRAIWRVAATKGE